MNKQQFLGHVWRLEEMLMQSDYLRSQIGKCGGGCNTEDEGLCPECCEVYEMVMDEDKRLSGNKEFTAVLTQIKQACDEDKSGEYQMIFEQFRESKVVH